MAILEGGAMFSSLSSNLIRTEFAYENCSCFFKIFQMSAAWLVAADGRVFVV
jgi:hypothetical protein